MARWRKVLSMTAILVAGTLVVSAAQQPRQGRARERGARAKLAKQAATLAVKAVAKECGLTAEKAKKFVAAYLEERDAARKRFVEARQAGQRRNLREVFIENRKRLNALCEEYLGAEKAKTAAGLLGMGGLERSIVALLRAKVDEAKVEKAMPVLIEYHKNLGELFAKVRSGEISRQDAGPKFSQLRDATAKKLGPIVGEEAAAAWHKLSARIGPRPGQRGRRPGGGGGPEPRRGGQ